jgi:hypothetical protein
MTDSRASPSVAHRAGTGITRVIRAWRAMPHERRLAAFAAIGLFLTLFLPWYQETVIAPGTKTLQSASATLTGWGAFSLVEAAVLLVAAGVLTLLFQRAEGRAFHLPGGDGWVIMAAGFWTCVLIVWRIFDKQGTSSHGQFATTSGIEWGIFVALAVAAFLAYSGSRIRAAHQPEPPLPGEEGPPNSPPSPPPEPARRTAPDRRLADDRPANRHADDRPTNRPADDRPANRHADDRPATRPVRPPRPVPADDPPTMKLGAPSTPAARRGEQPDEQLTMPLDNED